MGGARTKAACDKAAMAGIATIAADMAFAKLQFAMLENHHRQTQEAFARVDAINARFAK